MDTVEQKAATILDALEMARCSKINLENMSEITPFIKANPLYSVVDLQIDETIRMLKELEKKEKRNEQ